MFYSCTSYLQEYFAAGHLAQRLAASLQELAPLIRLAHVKWREAEIVPSVQELLETLSKSAILPDLSSTG